MVSAPKRNWPKQIVVGGAGGRKIVSVSVIYVYVTRPMERSETPWWKLDSFDGIWPATIYHMEKIEACRKIRTATGKS